MCDFADDREWPEWPVESKAGFFGDLQSTAVRLPRIYTNPTLTHDCCHSLWQSYEAYTPRSVLSSGAGRVKQIRQYLILQNT